MSTILITRQPKRTNTIRYTDSLDAGRQLSDLNFIACNGEYNADSGNLTLYSAEGEQLILVNQGDKGEYESRLRVCNILVKVRIFSSTSAAVAGTFGTLKPGEDPVRRSFHFTRSNEGAKVILTDYVTKDQAPS